MRDGECGEVNDNWDYVSWKGEGDDGYVWYGEDEL